MSLSAWRVGRGVLDDRARARRVPDAAERGNSDFTKQMLIHLATGGGKSNFGFFGKEMLIHLVAGGGNFPNLDFLLRTC